MNYLLEAIDRELFWESMQDHGWKPSGDVLESPDDQNITVAKNRQMYYRGVSARMMYSDRNYKLLLRFEQNAAKWCKKSPDLLTFASEALQLAAVRKNGYAIYYIENPSEAVQLAAVRQDGAAIEYIGKPSKAVQLAAVQQHGGAICHIKNPSEEVQLAAVQKDGWAIQHIRNPSEAIQLAAVWQNRYVLKSIRNPSEAVKREAAREKPNAIMFVARPHRE